MKQLPFIKRATDSVVEEFKGHIRKAVEYHEQNYFDDQIKRLRETAKATEDSSTEKPVQQEQPQSNIVTTVHELQGLSTVKSILYKAVQSDKILLKDYENYCNVVYKAQGSPTIVRMHFNEAEAGKFFISFPGNDDLVNLGKIQIKDVEAMNDHIDKIINTAKKFLEQKEKPVKEKTEKQTQIPDK